MHRKIGPDFQENNLIEALEIGIWKVCTWLTGSLDRWMKPSNQLVEDIQYSANVCEKNCLLNSIVTKPP
jgi:hypothetical protein